MFNIRDRPKKEFIGGEGKGGWIKCPECGKPIAYEVWRNTYLELSKYKRRRK